MSSGNGTYGSGGMPFAQGNLAGGGSQGLGNTRANAAAMAALFGGQSAVYGRGPYYGRPIGNQRNRGKRGMVGLPPGLLGGRLPGMPAPQVGGGTLIPAQSAVAIHYQEIATYLVGIGCEPRNINTAIREAEQNGSIEELPAMHDYFKEGINWDAYNPGKSFEDMKSGGPGGGAPSWAKRRAFVLKSKS